MNLEYYDNYVSATIRRLIIRVRNFRFGVLCLLSAQRRLTGALGMRGELEWQRSTRQL